MNTSISSIVSLGVLASRLQVHVKRIKAVAAEIGIEPTLRINGTPFFDSADAEIIAESLRNQASEGESR